MSRKTKWPKGYRHFVIVPEQPGKRSKRVRAFRELEQEQRAELEATIGTRGGGMVSPHW